ncbi:excinuclease ABC subunit C [Natronincola peptidivorans]|uniref:Excinuclease ABC subunit C n=1 Tax=Natronincola peptidivorans TaxID=426128 RepID=A0A1I0EHV7_9FIRM|nr:excinuclease ABC subunit C [Natronincola peptidivorans]
MPEIPKFLIQKINRMPAKPGIYQMKDREGNIMYIGKSKALKSRVKSYFSIQGKSEKIERMLFHIHDIDYIVTDTHLEAQILECTLIKKLKPIYNVQFKNDQNYRYLKVENYNKIKPVKVISDREDANCFGPYRNKKILSNLEKLFQNIYPILKHGDSYGFFYKILPEAMKKDAFEENKQCLMEILSKEECMLRFISEIEKKMKLAAAEFHFETALIYKDLLYHINYLYDVSIKKAEKLKWEKILMGEKIEDGYKLFYISSEIIVLKQKYKEIKREAIEEFIIRAKKLENNRIEIKNEKSNLDFQYILHAEMKDKSSKAILFLDKEYNLEELVNKLR